MFTICGFLLSGNSLFSQPFDTLVLEFSTIQEITPLEDGTFILIGHKKNSIRVARINSKAEILWLQVLTDTIFYELGKNEVHITDIDSSIQLLVYKTQCDIIPPGIASLYTVDFDGKVKDIMLIPFETLNDRIFILSGNDTLPRYAKIIEDSVFVFFHNGDSIGIVSQFPKFPLRLVDLCPSGNLVISRDFWTLLIYSRVGDEYVVTSTSWGLPGSHELICASDNHFITRYYDQISSADTFESYTYYTAGDDEDIVELKWKNPYLYLNSTYWGDPDTFKVLDVDLNVIYKEGEIYPGPYVYDRSLYNNTIFRVGLDRYYPYPNGFLESEELITHSGPKYYDVTLLDAQLSTLDSLSYQSNCWPPFVENYLSEVRVTILNNSHYPLNEVMVGYEDYGQCCYRLSWERKLTNMNIMPGESKTYLIPDFVIGRDALHGTFTSFIEIFAPDQHADDRSEDNDFCFENVPTHIRDTESNPIFHFPDPVHDYLYFNLPEQNKIIIFDLNGDLIKDFIMHKENSHINVSHLQPGVYILIYYAKNGTITREKFVKI